jgi:hypothetical protein
MVKKEVAVCLDGMAHSNSGANAARDSEVGKTKNSSPCARNREDTSLLLMNESINK